MCRVGPLLWIIVLTAGLPLSGLLLAADSSPATPLVLLRAEHMILDAVVHGGRILVGTQSGRVQVFDWREGAPRDDLLVLRAAPGQAFPPSLRALALSPSGRLLAAASSDGALRVLVLAPDGSASPRLELAPGDVLSAVFLGENRLLVGTMRGEVALLDLDSGEEIFRQKLEYDPVHKLAPSPDTSLVAVGFRSSRIQIIDAHSGERWRSLRGHRDSVFGLAWLGEHRLVSAGKDKRVLGWDLRGPAARPQVLYSGDSYVTALAADRAGERLALTLDEERVGILSVANSRILRVLEGHTAPVQVLRFVAHGKRLISAGHDARILVWDVGSDVGSDGEGAQP